MKKDRTTIDIDLTQGPIGIIISRGDRAEPAPLFTAYVWGPAPEVSETVSHKTKAA